MVDANEVIKAIDQKLREEEEKGTTKEYLSQLGFSFEEKNVPNVEKTNSEKKDD